MEPGPLGTDRRGRDAYAPQQTTMPRRELKHPRQVEDWLVELSEQYGSLTVKVPSPPDLLVPKRKRNEPRDRAHEDWTRRVGLLD